MVLHTLYKATFAYLSSPPPFTSSSRSWFRHSSLFSFTIKMESRTPTYIFNVLAATGFILLFATVVPAALSSNIHRSKTWFSMIISWMVYAASYLLILGYQLGPEGPPRGICGLQMLFIYACPPL
ncbi:hypothetical protein B0H19DRAFT_459200 [Mycena capillaripes]|nr:hypothetical protein B0H19DRAFT_459200 [Mycena capillaripes]